jgi:hypothetical protein
MALGSTPLSARQLPPEVAASAGPADRAAAYTTTRDQFERGGRGPLALTILSKPGSADRAPLVAAEAKRALALLDEWLGPLAGDRLTIIDAPWNSRLVGGSYAGVVAVHSRWLSQARDRALERELIAGLTRQYWAGDGDVFMDGLAAYIGGRAIDTLLEGSHFHADRFIGGFMPYALRPVSLSPQPRDARPRLRRYAEIGGGPAAEQVARTLEVAERYFGWPVLQQALSTFRGRSLRSAEQFAAVLTEQRGADASWLFREALRDGVRFDYALAALESRPAGDQFGVRVTVESRGNGVFGRPLTLATRFADGTSRRDWWDPRQPAAVDYVSASAAVEAAIDPDLILILDEQRSNNVMRLERQPWNRLALKLACDWAIWLQQAMLTYSGIV